MPFFFLLTAAFFLVTENLSWAQTQSERAEIVNRQLDDIQMGFTGMQQNADKIFSRESPDAQKTFSEDPQDKTPQTVQSIKKILDPDLSLVNNKRTRSPSNVRTRVHNFDVGAEVFYYRYEEPAYTTQYGDRTSDVKNTGPMYGFYGNYTFRPAAPGILNSFISNAYFLQARFSAGHGIDYKGYGIVKSKFEDATELRGLIGKDYNLGKLLMVTPYFGFGYRYLFDHGNGKVSSSGYIQEDQKSHYFYLPLGTNLDIDLPNSWAAEFNGEYDIFLSGYQKWFDSNYDQLSGGSFPDWTLHQDHGFGLRGSVKLIKKGSLLDFYVEPYFRYWNIEGSKSEAISYDGGAPLLYWQPKNSTTEIGSKFGVQF